MTYVPYCQETQAETTEASTVLSEARGPDLRGKDLATQQATLDPANQPGFDAQSAALAPPEGCQTFEAMDIEIQSMLTYLATQRESSALENEVSSMQDSIGKLSTGLTSLHSEVDGIVTGEYGAVVRDLIEDLRAQKADVSVTPGAAVFEGTVHASVASIIGLVPVVGDVGGYLYSVATGPVMTGLQREEELAAAETAQREAREAAAKRSGDFANQQQVLVDLTSQARSELQSLLTSPYSLVYSLGEAVGGAREVYRALPDQEAHYLTEEGDAQTPDEHEELTQLRDELAGSVARHDTYLATVATAQAAIDEAASVGLEAGGAWVEDVRFAYLEWLAGGRYSFGEGATELCGDYPRDCMVHPKDNLLLHGHEEPTAAIADIKVTDLLRRGEVITVDGITLRQDGDKVHFSGADKPPRGFTDWQAFYDFLNEHTLGELGDWDSFRKLRE